ncbi:MAG: glycoside hydrolase family 127 protein [Bryobacteraceae bacterium]|nr:glycoside hydrolase family 127 protein [Bryobacteraceae bacterium]
MVRLTIAFVAAGILAAQAPPKVQDRFEPARLTRLGGQVGERFDINLEKRLLRVNQERLLRGFEQRPGEQDWIGEHIGKFLDAAANTYEHKPDERLKALMDRLTSRLLATQADDGYLGTYLPKDYWTSWDVWVHKYDLIGLLAYHRVSGDPKALEAARRVGELLMKTFGEGPGQRSIIKASTHVGMAATSVLEPVVYLYKATGDERLLRFAGFLVKSWEEPGGPRVLTSLLEHGNVRKTANNKAYEMMSCLVGLLELYRYTGDASYLKAAAAAWEDIRARRRFITGTTSNLEHFQEDHVLPGLESSNVGETCATVTWMQLGWELLRLTGEAKYAEELERSIYNHLLGAQNPANGDYCYFTPLIGRKRPSPGINCCVSSGPRGISLIPQMAMGRRADAVAVLLLAPAEGKVTLNGTEVNVRAEGDYRAMKIRVDAGRAMSFPVEVRIPEWVTRTLVRVNGKTWNAKPGAIARVEREWKPGDVLEVWNTLRPMVHDGGPTYAGSFAVQYGPQVYAVDRAANPEVPYLHLVAGGRKPAVRRGAEDGVLVLKAEVATPARRRMDIRLTPFSEASDLRVWIPRELPAQPEALPVTLFGRESQSRNENQLGSIVDGRGDTSRATNGRGAVPPDGDFFAVELPRAEKIARVVFRQGPVGERGGAFAGKPRVEYQAAAGGAWTSLGDLGAYAGKAGEAYELKLPEPVAATAIRVIGRPAGASVSCAELEAYVR